MSINHTLYVVPLFVTLEGIVIAPLIEVFAAFTETYPVAYVVTV